MVPPELEYHLIHKQIRYSIGILIFSGWPWHFDPHKKIRTKYALCRCTLQRHRGIRSGNTFVFTFQNKPVLKHMPWTADTTDSYVSFSDCHCCCYHLSGQCQVCWPWKSVQLNQLLIIILICCLFYVLLSFWMYIFLSYFFSYEGLVTLALKRALQIRLGVTPGIEDILQDKIYY